MVRVCLAVSLVTLSWSQSFSEDQTPLVNASEYLMKGFSPYVNPCYDFYSYACGSWSYNSASVNDEFEQSSVEIREKLYEAISGLDSQYYLPNYKQSVLTFLKQCLNDNVTKTDVLLQLFEGLTRIMGDSPIFSIEGSKELEKENVWYLLGKIKRDLVTDVFFFTGIDVLDQGCAGQVPVLKFSPILAEMYSFMNYTGTVEQIMTVAEMLNIQIDEATVEDEVAKMVQFEQNLVSFLNESETEREAKEWTTVPTDIQKAGNASTDFPATLGDDTLTDDTWSDFDPIGMAKLMSINPNISWSDFFLGLFSVDQLRMFDENNTVVIIQDHDFFRKLSKLVDATDIDVIFNYIFWKAMNNYAQYTLMTSRSSSAMVDDSPESIKDTCLSTVMELFPAAATRILFDYNNWNVDEWRSDIEVMADTVFSAFKFMIMTNDMLTNQDKSIIIKKVNAIKFSSGLPEWLNDDYAVDEHTIVFNSTYNAYENLLEINSNGLQKQLDMLIRGITTEDPEPSFAVVSDYWNFTISNQMGLALPPLFHPDYPLSMKYGFLGAAIGRELVQAFDSDNVVNYPNGMTEWLSLSPKDFTQKKQCLAKQLTSYCAKEKQQCDFVSQTINEILADIDGIKIAFIAYKFAFQMLGETASVPQFSMITDDQLFFLTHTRAWCSADRHIEQFSANSLNSHASSETRIIATMRNFPVFAETFQCPVGSKYAPSKTCETWGSFEQD